MVGNAKSTDAAIVTGLLWIGSMLLFLFVDPVLGWRTQDEFYEAVAASPFLYQLPRFALSATAFVGIAAVREISRLFRNRSRALLPWSELLVIVGLALVGVAQARFALINPERAIAYVEGDAPTRVAIEAGRFLLQLDPNAFLSSLFLVVWLFVVNRLALTTEEWPRAASTLGLAVCLVSVVGMSARGLGLEPMIRVASLLNRFVVPAWFLWVGFALHTRRAAPAETGAVPR